MPELPEVETVRRGLAPLMEGQAIARAEVRRPDLRWPLPARMAERLTGQTVASLRRRSKYILADLSGGETLLIHLGMSGRMLIAAPGETDAMPGNFTHATGMHGKHDHIELTMASGARITFNDPRRFGMWDLFTGNHPLLEGIGPEPFSNALSPAWLADRLAGRRTPVKAALLDQSTVAGLGNIYVCEVLFRAGIHPATLAGSLVAAQTEALVVLIRDVLAEAIKAGGSSLRDYRQADGELGYFQHSFRVYGREGAACPACATAVARIVQSGRSSFFCPSCQR